LASDGGKLLTLLKKTGRYFAVSFIRLLPGTLPFIIDLTEPDENLANTGLRR